MPTTLTTAAAALLVLGSGVPLAAQSAPLRARRDAARCIGDACGHSCHGPNTPPSHHLHRRGPHAQRVGRARRRRRGRSLLHAPHALRVRASIPPPASRSCSSSRTAACSAPRRTAASRAPSISSTCIRAISSSPAHGAERPRTSCRSSGDRLRQRTTRRRRELDEHRPHLRRRARRSRRRKAPVAPIAGARRRSPRSWRRTAAASVASPPAPRVARSLRRRRVPHAWRATEARRRRHPAVRRRCAATAASPTPTAPRSTRAFGTAIPVGLRLELEGAAQTGTQSFVARRAALSPVSSVRAWLLGARLARSCSWACGGTPTGGAKRRRRATKSRLHSVLDALSGDDTPNDDSYTAFSTMFATNHPFYGLMDVIGDPAATTKERGLRDAFGTVAVNVVPRSPRAPSCIASPSRTGNDRALGRRIRPRRSDQAPRQHEPGAWPQPLPQWLRRARSHPRRSRHDQALALRPTPRRFLISLTHSPTPHRLTYVPSVRAFLKSSLAWLALGVTPWRRDGGTSGVDLYRLAHVHMMLLGFVAMMIFGVAYHVIPNFAGFPLHRPAGGARALVDRQRRPCSDGVGLRAPRSRAIRRHDPPLRRRHPLRRRRISLRLPHLAYDRRTRTICAPAPRARTAIEQAAGQGAAPSPSSPRPRPRPPAA